MDTLQSGLSRGAHLYHGVAHSPARGEGGGSGGGAGGGRQEAPLLVLDPHPGGEDQMGLDEGV